MATKINLQESKDRAIEVNNVIYPIAKRTGELEERILEEHDSKLDELTEYERYKVLISLILGEAAFDKLFPKGKQENLDLMGQIYVCAQREFNADIVELEKQKLSEQISASGVDELTGALDRFNRQIDKTISKAEMAKIAGKKRKK